MNALHFACYKCDMNLIKLFIDNGIDPKAKTLIGLNYLHIAAQRNKVSIFYFILNKFKIDLYETDNNGNYFLHWACHYANDRIIIMPGKGITNENYNDIVAFTKCKEIHGTKIVGLLE